MPQSPAHHVTIPNVRAIRATSKALLVEIDIPLGDGRYWIPQSAIHSDSEVWQPGQEGALVIPLWLAEERGIDGVGT